MTQQKFSPVLLIHGGAWAIPDDMVEAHLRGVRAAMAAGWKLLAEGKTALDAVEAAVVAMEDDETFDAGRGSFLTSDGRVQLDALMMDGKTLRAGGIGCVEHIRNPIRLAHKVLTESPHVYLVAEGAERFATEHGIELCDNSELIIPREVERLRRFKAAGQPDSTFAGAAAEVSRASSHDTVGAVALDANGDLAAATSTGGTLNKTPGRVGDSSLIGCGCYADNMKAAVSCTGWGEPIMKLVLGKWACDRVEEGDMPQVVAKQAITYLKTRVNGHGGLILLDQKGRIGAFHNTPRMAWGLKNEKQEHAQVEGDAFMDLR
jgi:beta-aspartyl-peptidase (threonine type)